ncbi:MAG: murein biosynthesis integral membrane protein MurJ [Saccharofermentans sp.]|nr:murein biosynthesis integral membrane protein MurJ [Saccharofermentans sp.]
MSTKRKNGSGNMAIATVLVMIGLIFSKCSGLLRDVLVGMKFSDTVYRDSFFLAFTIPDLVFNLLVGGSIQSAITPSLSAAVSAGEEKKGWRAVNIFISVIGTVLVLVCILGVVFSDQIFMLYASGKNNMDTIHLASQASKWLFPQIFFMMLAALCIGILNAYKRFSSTAFGPTVYNVFVLLSILIFAGNTESKLTMTTCGIMGAAVIYFLFQFIIGFDKLKQLRFDFKPRDPEFIALFKRALPILISASIVQVNTVILNFFTGSFEDSGYISALKNAATTWQLPYGIFAVAVGNVMLPSLAALYSKQDYDGASNMLSSRLKSALFLTIPSAGIMFVLNKEVIKALFQWNSAYTESDATRAGIFLMGYSIAIITHTVVFIMNQAFYAIGKTKVPLYAGCVGLISNPMFCYLFIKMGIGPLSLTLAYSLTSIFTLVILTVVYCKDKRLAPKGLSVFLAKSFGCMLVMSFVLVLLNKVIPNGNGKIQSLMFLGVKGICAVAVYFIGAFVLKMNEAVEFVSGVKRKILRR